jgi:hypothetical protein
MGEKKTPELAQRKPAAAEPITAGKTAPAPPFNLTASSPVQAKKEKKEKAPEVAKVTASGTFSITDPAGQERTFSIKNATVLEGSGKQAKEVGSIDGAGNYTLTLDGSDQPITGSLVQLPPEKVKNVSISEKKGKKEIRSININREQVLAGTIYFDDGAYTVKNGKLIRVADKKEAGSLSVVTGGEGGGSEIAAIRYTYTDAAGKVQTGDLVEGNFASKGRTEGDMEMKAGEGSQIKMSGAKGTAKGSKLMGYGATGKKWHEMTKSGKGYKMKSKERVKETLLRLKKEGKITISDEQIELLIGVSQVESSGTLNVINSYDSDKMSAGFKQFTAAGKLQDWVGRDEAAWKKYGIELERDADGKLVEKTIKQRDGKDVKAPGFKGMKKADELRNNVWAMRFFEAGLDDDIIADQVEKAIEYADKILRYVKRANAGADLFDKPVVKAILLELFNNREAYLKPVTEKSQARLGASATLEDLLSIMEEEIKAIYKLNWQKHGNGDTEAEGEEKGARLYRKITAIF